MNTSDVSIVRERYRREGIDVHNLDDAQVMALWLADCNNDLDGAMPDLEDREFFIANLSSGMTGRESADAYIAKMGDVL